MKIDVSLSKRLGDFDWQARFSAEGGQLGVFGPSGSGKSTLMNLLAGLLKPDSGHIRLDGSPIFESASSINLPPEKRRIGVVFQHAHLFPHMGVRRNLLYGFRRTPANERRIDTNDLIEALNLGPLLDRGVKRLSGGERQRVALGRTLLACPRLILMDEPLTGLDEGLKYQIIPYLKQVFNRFEIPYIFISHSLNEMRLMTDRVLEFAQGEMTGEVSSELLARRGMGTGQGGYSNLMEMGRLREDDGLYIYRWGGQEICLSNGGDQDTGMFEIMSKDITLFKRHPEASSARNMLQCRVVKVFEAGNRIGVELDCHGQRLMSQVVGSAVRDLGLEPGSAIIAVIKASAFRRLY
ncbi:MAG: molybdenum ABC transporter ATP-binding protein [Desulfuromonas sp.]|nr:MAG: molybdenum ABC transporter ATP-binding protein [Desulfuromonas sp.]